MKYMLLFTLVKTLYAGMLRDMLKEKINDPNSDHDEELLMIADSIFGYVDMTGGK